MKIKLFIPFFIILAVSLLYSRPFFNQGYFPTDDGEWAIVRLSEMIRELKDFQMPPRWSDYLNHGYGYPLFSFTYPLPYYLGSFVHLFGLGLTETVKFLFVISVLLSGIFMYLLGKELIDKKAGIVAALFYVVSPYRLTNLFVRGSLGESLNFAVFPLLCYGSLVYLKKKNKWSFLLTSFSLAILILTHNASALLFFPFWILFLMTINYYYKGNLKQLLIYYLPVILLGIGVSAYFLFPAIFEKKYIVLSQKSLANIGEYFVSPYNLGFLNIAGFLLGVFSLIVAKNREGKNLYYILFFLIPAVSGMFFLNSLSSFFWTMPPLNWLDFPFRLLGPLTFLISLGAAFVVKNKIMLRIGYVIIVITILYNLQQVTVKEYFVKPDSYYTTNDATTTSNNELTPVWVKEKPTNRYQSKVEVIQGQADINSLEYSSNKISFDLTSKTVSTIVINTLYFPGWKIKLNGEEIPLEIEDKKGIIIFDIPSGKFRVSGKFTETGIRQAANLVTLFTLLFCLMIIIKPKWYETHK